ncbi:hypothetical protein NFI96_004182 [Prochilodus magdalenae]|nr:hypothetical protein NFI96_004182 [Prochilodus magdalenae]
MVLALTGRPLEDIAALWLLGRSAPSQGTGCVELCGVLPGGPFAVPHCRRPCLAEGSLSWQELTEQANCYANNSKDYCYSARIRSTVLQGLPFGGVPTVLALDFMCFLLHSYTSLPPLLLLWEQSRTVAPQGKVKPLLEVSSAVCGSGE